MTYEHAREMLLKMAFAESTDFAEDRLFAFGYSDEHEALIVAIKAIETVERLVEVVPNNTPYCYKSKGFDFEKGVMHVERCPFWKIRRDIEWDCNVEYCALLGKDLEVQDSVKDCGISCGL